MKIAVFNLSLPAEWVYVDVIVPLDQTTHVDYDDWVGHAQA